MSLQSAIVTKLKADATVNGIIAGRILPIGRPAPARPNIVIQVIGTGRFYGNQGSTGISRATVQLSCYADDYKPAAQLASAVASVFDGFTGAVDGVKFHSVFIDDERDAPEPPAPGGTAAIAGVILVLLVAYSE